jgi:molybdopterin-guanine dinucleotide biosynthesis protein A
LAQSPPSAGIVLCGGRSSRMGRPKAWLPFGDETLLGRVVRELAQVVAPVVVVAGPDQALPALPGAVELVRDDQPDLGPLNGLAAGLTALAGRAEVAFVASCDLPLLSAGFVRRVIEGMGTADAGVPRVGGRSHPLASAYRISVLPVVQGLLTSGERRMMALVEAVRTRFLSDAELRDVDGELDSLRNVNTPGEYQAALVRAGYRSGG